MSDDKFQSIKVRLQSTLERCENLEIQLPDFQRGWVWNVDKIKNLIGSVANSYPIGSIMHLVYGGDLKVATRCIEGVQQGTIKKEPDLLILDGQQRITSLYQAMMQKNVVKTISDRNKREVKRWFYIDMKSAVNEPDDITEAVISVPENKKTEIIINGKSKNINLSEFNNEFKYFMFPVNNIFDSFQWRLDFLDYWNATEDSEHRKLLDDFSKFVIKNVSDYQIPVIELYKTNTIASICVVFEKVNTKGQSLDAFELLTAIFASNNFQLRKDWSTINENMNENSESNILQEIPRINFLKVISLLKSKEEGKKATCSRSQILDIELEDYKKYKSRAESGFIRASKFLSELCFFRSSDVPYQSQLVSLAAILADLESEWENESYKNKLKRWYWCGVFGEIYSASSDSRIAKDFTEVPKWLNGQDEPSTIKRANFQMERFDSIRLGNSAIFRGIIVLLMNNGAIDLNSGRLIIDHIEEGEDVNIHHIFPKDWCKSNGKDAEKILNKTPLTNITNRNLGGGHPSKYLRKIDKSIDKKSVLESHLIPIEFLENDDYEGFIKERKKLLNELIQKVIGKEDNNNDLENEMNQNNQTCPICDGDITDSTRVQIEDTTISGELYKDCPTCGKYFLSDHAKVELATNSATKSKVRGSVNKSIGNTTVIHSGEESELKGTPIRNYITVGS